MVASSERCQPSRASLYLHLFDEVLKLEVLRGTEPKTLFIRVLERKDSADTLSGLANSRENFFSIGILDLNDELRFIVGTLRRPWGVVVVARVANFMSSATGLETGDVIPSVNQTPIYSLSALRAALAKVRTDEAA